MVPRNFIFLLNMHNHFIQCMACLWKQHWSYWHNPPYTAERFLFTTFVVLMFGTMFWDHGSKTGRKQDMFNAIGSMYNVILFLGTQNANSVQRVVAIERTVFYRERVAGMYSAIPYAIAQSIPVWWRWYYWVCPVAWTLYGLVASQIGDVTSTIESNETVKEFLRRYSGYRDDFVGIVAGVVVGFTVLFSLIFAISVKVFNFQRR